ncbi:MAG: hypothetical protein U0931_07705 [Vulcanimicrobiota bacterium]
MKKFLLAALCAIALQGSASADPLDESLAKYAAIAEGKVTFQLKVQGMPWTQNSTLVFRRPDKMHYWAETKYPEGPPLVVHCWLEGGKLWSWTSRVGDWEDAQKNAYRAEDFAGGLKDAPTSEPLGPGNFLLLLLSGSRQEFELEPSKSSEPDIWWKDGENQLVLDPATRLVKEIVAWSRGKDVAHAQVQTAPGPVAEDELTWKMPADSTVIKL